jgi:hypothetical protein
MNRHWTVSIDGGAPVHLDLAQYAAAIERARQEGKPARVMIETDKRSTYAPARTASWSRPTT